MCRFCRRLEGNIRQGDAEQLEGGVRAVDPWDFFLWPQYNSVEESLRN